MGARGGAASRVVAAAATLVVLIAAVLAYSFLSSAAGTGTGRSTDELSSASTPLITFSADAYTSEVQALLDGFTSATGVSVAPVHPGGSFVLARQIASGSQVDVFIPVALSAAAPSNLENFSSGWAIGFASDQMVIAYSNATLSSPSGAAVVRQYEGAAASDSTSDWNTAFASLTSGNVKVGIADPNADPAGARGWLVLEAAGFFYGGNQAAYTGALLHAGANVTGSAAANMVAPLQAGQIQFLFIYKSAAVAQHLDYVQLDQKINLGDVRLAATYAQFSYPLSTGLYKGAPIVLCVTIPRSAPHVSEAMQFVLYVVKDSSPVVSSYGLQGLAPPLLFNDTAAPQPFAQMLSQGTVASGGTLGP